MNRGAFAALSFLLATGTIADDSIYFSANHGNWSVFGHKGIPGVQNPACVAETKWTDGSNLQVIQDLADGELHVIANSNSWEVEGPYGRDLDVTVTIHGDKIINSVIAKFILVDKNTVQLRNIDHSSFLSMFMRNQKMVLVMPADMKNLEVSLKGTAKSVEEMAKCIASLPKTSAIPKKKGIDS